MSCIFCKIVNKEIPAKIVYNNRKIIAFKDIDPKAPVHIVIIPKKHILPANLEPKDKIIIGEMFLAAKKIAKDFKVDKTGYRIVLNVGKDAGQTIEHLHLHLMGGEKLPFA